MIRTKEHVEFVGMAWKSEVFLRGCRLHFNENLNVLIGGSGIGPVRDRNTCQLVLGYAHRKNGAS